MTFEVMTKLEEMSPRLRGAAQIARALSCDSTARVPDVHEALRLLADMIEAEADELRQIVDPDGPT